jgi:O-antigen ligase
MTVNLMKYKRWIKTCILSFIVPAVVVAFIGIVQYSLGAAPSGWIDSEMFSGITSRVVSVFNNPNILGLYLAMIFPFVLLLFYHKSPNVKILGCISVAFILVCVAFTYSRSAWIALLCGGIAFAVMVTPRGILWLIPSIGAGLLACLAFPKSIGARINNFVTLADSANSYRMSVWNSSWNMLTDTMFGGVGLGEEAFRTAYINYAAAGTQSAPHSHSLYMQIAIQLGVIGLILFGVLMFVVCRKCLSSSIYSGSSKEISVASRAALAGAISLLTAGFFDYTWYNFRVFFIFWALLGIACAAVNIHETENSEDIISEGDEYSYSLTVNIPKAKSVNEAEREEEKHE